MNGPALGKGRFQATESVTVQGEASEAQVGELMVVKIGKAPDGWECTILRDGGLQRSHAAGRDDNGKEKEN